MYTTRLMRTTLWALLLSLTLGLTGGMDLRTEQALAADEAQQERVSLPIVNNRSCGGLKQPGPFGVQMFGTTGATNRFNPSLLESGAQWVRAEIDWRRVEPENTNPPTYNWDYVDRTLRAVLDTCVNMIVTHEYNPDWAATSPHGPVDRVPVSRMADYLAAFAERYDGDGFNDAPGSPMVRYFELYNEPDATGPGINRWAHHGAEYAQMLATVYPAMKAANPDVQVVFAGIAYDWFEDLGGPFVRHFLDDVLAAGGGAHFDVMNFHVYPPFAGNWTTNGGPGLYEKTQAVRAKLAEYGVNKPIVITEAGHHSNANAPIAGSPEHQVKNLVKLYTQTVAAGVEFTAWFLLYDLGGTYEYESGLVTNANPPQKKPAFFAYQQGIKMLSNVQPDRRLTSAETGAADMEAYRFLDFANNRVLYVAWLNPLNAGGQKLLTVDGAAGTVIDVFGGATPITDGSDGSVDGKLSVAISAMPVYIVVPN